MAKNVVEVEARREDVYRILLDPYAYPRWVVGTRKVRGADDDWPSPGSSFHHSVVIAGRDRSEMLRHEENRRVTLKVFTRPMAVGVVDIQLEETPSGGTRVTMYERPAPGTKLRMVRALLDPLIWLRNAEGLRRFRKLVRESTSGASA